MLDNRRGVGWGERMHPLAQPGPETLPPAATSLDAVDQATARRRHAEAAAQDAVEEQTTAIRAAIAAGVTTIDLARVSGMSRARIYQIRDGRR